MAQFHDAHFADAAERLRKASLLPLAAAWGLGDLTEAVEVYQKMGRFDSKYPVSLFESIVMAAGCLGDIHRASAALAKYEAVASTWPGNILARCGGHRPWAESLRRLINDPEALREAAKRHAEKLKVSHLPRVEMLS